jgi:hypothetical protein
VDNVTTYIQDGFPDNGDNYLWRVKAGNDTGWSRYSVANHLTNGSLSSSSNPVPEVPGLSSPEDNTDVPGDSIQFEWNASEYATKYIIKIKNITTDTVFNVAIVDNDTTYIQNGFPDNGDEYIWRVRAGNDTGWSRYSAAFSFTNGS